MSPGFGPVFLTTSIHRLLKLFPFFAFQPLFSHLRRSRCESERWCLGPGRMKAVGAARCNTLSRSSRSRRFFSSSADSSLGATTATVSGDLGAKEPERGPGPLAPAVMGTPVSATVGVDATTVELEGPERSCRTAVAGCGTTGTTVATAVRCCLLLRCRIRLRNLTGV